MSAWRALNESFCEVSCFNQLTAFGAIGFPRQSIGRTTSIRIWIYDWKKFPAVHQQTQLECPVILFLGRIIRNLPIARKDAQLQQACFLPQLQMRCGKPFPWSQGCPNRRLSYPRHERPINIGFRRITCIAFDGPARFLEECFCNWGILLFYQRTNVPDVNDGPCLIPVIPTTAMFLVVIFYLGMLVDNYCLRCDWCKLTFA